MSTSSKHIDIKSFLEKVRATKSESKVLLRMDHGFSKGYFQARGVVTGSELQNSIGLVFEEMKECNEEKKAKQTSPEERLEGFLDPELDTRPLRIGETIEFAGISPVAGYVHLFNFGTSGHVFKLAPVMESKKRMFERGEDFRIPADDLLPEWILQKPITEDGPLSSLHNEPERLFVLVTREDMDIQETDLHPNFECQFDIGTRSVRAGKGLGTLSTRGGFAETPSVETLPFFKLDPESWEYGLIEKDVVA